MEMCILKGNEYILSRFTLLSLSSAEMVSDTEKAKNEDFTAVMKIKLGPTLDDKESVSFSEESFKGDTKTPEFTPYSDGDMDKATTPEFDELPDYNKYISSEFMLPNNGMEMITAQVFERYNDKDGKFKG